MEEDLLTRYSSRDRRNLDDEQLDSGDDEGRDDRRGDRMDVADDGDQFDETEVNIMDVTLARAPVPVNSDGEVRGSQLIPSNHLTQVYKLLTGLFFFFALLDLHNACTRLPINRSRRI